MPENFNIATFLMTLTAFVLGITVHEWAHAIVADKLGDDTPRLQGRVTLWPLAHLDPLGTVFMIGTIIFGTGIGWGKPVQTNPNRYRINHRLGMALVSVAGPFSNLVIATVFALFIRLAIFKFHLLPPEDVFSVWANEIVNINILLFLFNLLPIFPLDGSKMLAMALPASMGDAFLNFMMPFGRFILLGLVLSHALDHILWPAIDRVYDFLIFFGS